LFLHRTNYIYRTILKYWISLWSLASHTRVWEWNN
jgi:hypothetical protein